MGSNAEPLPTHPKPWIKTPLIRSTALSKIAGCNIYLKLENHQPSGSFKSRGIGQMILSSLPSPSTTTTPSPRTQHFYSSSGGNAGLACAHACLSLSLPCTIIVPESTSPLMITKLKEVEAEVIVHGKHWSEADGYLREQFLGVGKEGNIYIPPFDHPEVWKGNGGLVDEIEEQFAGLRGEEEDYDAVVCSVGGGGLFCGVMEGLERHGRLGNSLRGEVRVLAVETEGADSFSRSLREGARVRLEGITSIATSLGATMVCEKAFELGVEGGRKGVVKSLVLADREAGRACVRFLGDERVAVEAACGVGLGVVYEGYLRGCFKELGDEEFKRLNVVVVVCGGSNISLEVLEGYRKLYCGGEVVVGK